jgi:hypothetical protein
MGKYEDFLASKRSVDPMTGLDKVGRIPKFFKPHQVDITRWALKRGRSAIFAGTGLGKTLMELEWSRQVARFTGKPVLILAPLAVSTQHVREGEKFKIKAKIVRWQSDADEDVSVTNYQKLQHFDLSRFGGICLDESSILKNVDGHYRTKLIREAAQIPFRLAATATPAPNDFMELGNHAEFLGIMSYTDMLATFFIHDGGDTAKWRLKGHAEDAFWKWMASWAVMLRKPSDLGYDDTGYDLPPLNEVQHTVGVPYEPNIDTGLLFPMEANGLGERIKARRGSINSRVEKAASIIKEIWECQNVSMGVQRVELQNTCESTTQRTNISGRSKRETKKTLITNGLETVDRLIHSTPNIGERSAAIDRQKNDDGRNSENHSGLEKKNTTQCPSFKEGNAQSANVPSREKTGDLDLASIIATKLDISEDFSAVRVIEPSANLKTIQSGSSEQSNILRVLPREPWIIWCNLNDEQDMLERIFGDQCYSVRGSDEDENKEGSIAGWCAGLRPIMISKTSILGFGLNFQFCSNMIFIGASDSFEQTYQAVRRCWRFGQTKPVNAHFIAAETEGAVVANYRRKEADADRMAAAMVRHMADLSAQNVRGQVRDKLDYFPTQPMQIPSWAGAEL